MKKTAVIIILLFSLCACNNTTSQSSPSVPSPGSSGNETYNPKSFSYGSSLAVGSYTGDLYSIIINDTARKASYSIASSGTSFSARYVGGGNGPEEGEAIELKNYDLHSRFREKERETLLSGMKQAGKTNALYRTLPSSVTVGTLWNNVYVYQADTNRYKTVSAQCVAVGNHAYIFVDVSAAADPASDPALKSLMENYARQFDEKYEIMRANFGAENDVDGNGKVIILFTPLSNDLLGFFLNLDKYPSGSVSSSDRTNEADIFYVNYDFQDETENILSTLVHEFQHMILFDVRYNQSQSLENPTMPDTWLNEGLSMLSEYLCGYNANSAVNHRAYFLNNYQNMSLTNWTSNNYGYSDMFLRYLYENYGAGIIKTIYETNISNGVALSEQAAGKPFADIYKGFALNVFLSNRGVTSDPDYNFQSIDMNWYKKYALRGGSLIKYNYDIRPTAFAPNKEVSGGSQISGYINPYSFNIIRWTGSLWGLQMISGDMKGYIDK